MNEDLLRRAVVYKGERISARSLERRITDERAVQQAQIDQLDRLRKKHGGLQGALNEEVQRLAELQTHLASKKRESTFWEAFKDALSFLPGIDSPEEEAQSIEALLRQQYEVSLRRLHEAAAFADRLAVAEDDLYAEVERLNAGILDAAHNERTAADYLLAVEARRGELAAEQATTGSVRAREIQADMDRARRVLAEHANRMRLYSTAADRLERLKGTTTQLAQTIAELRSDITRYVDAAGHRLDLVAGQIGAVGAAADAARVVTALQEALEGMSETLNQATRFVVDTQAYFRDHVDELVSNLDTYDEETRALLTSNLASSTASDELEIGVAVERARRTTGAPRGL